MLFNKNFLIGQELLKREYISQEQLDEALIYQQRKNIRLGKALIELGYLSEEDLVKVIADQLGIKLIDFDNLAINQELLEKIPKKYIKSMTIFPVDYSDDCLTVCVVDPLEKKLKLKLENILDIDIKFAIALEKDILNAIDKYYDFD